MLAPHDYSTPTMFDMAQAERRERDRIGRVFRRRMSIARCTLDRPWCKAVGVRRKEKQVRKRIPECTSSLQNQLVVNSLFGSFPRRYTARPCAVSAPCSILLRMQMGINKDELCKAWSTLSLQNNSHEGIIEPISTNIYQIFLWIFEFFSGNWAVDLFDYLSRLEHCQFIRWKFQTWMENLNRYS